MVLKFCKTCQTKTEWDETPVCTYCGCFGKPEDDNAFFTEAIEYSDTKQVGTSVAGPERTRIKRTRSGVRSGAVVDSTWEAFEKGKGFVLNLATALNLPMGITTSAYNTYRLGLELKFTRGRSIEIAAAACLYIACRLNNHPVMLIDFVEHLASPISPVALSRLCIRLTRQLSISLPPVLGDSHAELGGQDPSPYLYRFAAKMSLGENAVVRAVTATALRVLRRMQEDWIHWGRHPAGLFGAALLIASRLHGFKRSRSEVSKCVYIGDTTLGKRVCDFANTPSASLSIAEFDNTEFEPCKPPAFERGRLQWKNPEEIIKWPEKLPSRPEDVKKWIEDGMGFNGGDVKEFEEDFTRLGDLGGPLAKEGGATKAVKKEKYDFLKLEGDESLDSDEIDRRADAVVILDEEEREKKSRIWDMMNKEWVDLKIRKAEEKRLEDKSKEFAPRKLEKKKQKRTMSSAYKLAMEERDKVLKEVKTEEQTEEIPGDEGALFDFDFFDIEGIDD